MIFAGMRTHRIESDEHLRRSADVLLRSDRARLPHAAWIVTSRPGMVHARLPRPARPRGHEKLIDLTEAAHPTRESGKP
jgi:hypothetical protein